MMEMFIFPLNIYKFRLFIFPRTDAKKNSPLFRINTGSRVPIRPHSNRCERVISLDQTT